MNSQISEILKSLPTYKDFPTEGVSFIDTLSLFKDPSISSLVFKETLALIGSDCILVVPEARGFTIAALANLCGIPVMFLRKEGKLPGKCTKVTYEKEYGIDTLEYRKDDLINFMFYQESSKLNIVFYDDIVATGNTIESVTKSFLSETLPFTINIRKFVFLGEIQALNGRKKLEAYAPVEVLCKL